MTDPMENEQFPNAVRARLAQIVKESSVPPPWSKLLEQLGPESSPEERLAVYQAVRAAGSVPEEASHFLIAWQVDAMALLDADEALREQEERLEAIARQHGLREDDTWSSGKEPPEYQEALRELQDAWDALFATKLEELGEHDMANLFRTDRARFEHLQDAGRGFFPQSPAADDEAWLDLLLEVIGGCIEADSPMGPLGMRYGVEDGFWEVNVFPTAVELVGGAQDGDVVFPGFSLDLEQFRVCFDEVSAFGWNALGLNDPAGPCVYFEGRFEGREIYLQVLAYAPDDEEPGLKVDARKRHGRGE